MSNAAALQRPLKRAEAWSDLNVFVAAFVVAASFGTFVFTIPASLVLKLVFPARQAELYAMPAGYLLVAAVLVYWWWRNGGLSPRRINTDWELRFRIGHGLLLVCNLALLPMYTLPWLGLGTRMSYKVLPSAVLPLMMLAPYGAIVGLIMVLGARSKAPEFVPTLPASKAEPRAAQPAILTARKSSGPPAIVVVLGLLGSSLLIYIATVFGALGFQDNPARFTNVVLPVVGACYVLYLATAIYLMTRRKTAAVWVAWTPVLLLVMASPISMLAGFVSAFFR